MQLNLSFEENIEPLKPPAVKKSRGKFLQFLPDNCVIVDIETTGLTPRFNEIIEISAIKVQNNKAVDTFSSLIKPSGDISTFITNLTGISKDMVKDCDDIKKVLEDFCSFVGDEPIVGHNIKFDLTFINTEMKKHFDTRLTNDFCDTLYFARKVYKNLKSHKLSTIARHLNIDTKGAHRGLKDCQMTFSIFLDMKKKLNSQASV